MTNLIATFTTTGQSTTVNGVAQVSGQTANNFTNPLIYIITAADGSKQNYTVTVTIAASDAKAITSFVLGGNTGVIVGESISVAVPYGTDVTNLIATFTTTGQSVTVNGVLQVNGQTANNFTNPLIYTVTAGDNSTQNYTVTVTVAADNSKAITTFVLDGNNGIINGTSISVTVPYGTDITNLTATFTTTGESVTVNGVLQVSGQTTNNFTDAVTYTVYAANNTKQDYTVTVTVAANDAKAITTFALNGSNGVINGHSIAVTVPYGTNVTSLIATFTTTGQSVTVGGVTQVSSQTPNDFTDPITYTVHAADGTTQDYIVTVTVAENTAKAITSFVLNGYQGFITGESISVVVPYGANRTNLIATFISTGQSVTVGTTPQVSGQTENDFTDPVTYTVHAADGTTQDYMVTVTIGPQFFTCTADGNDPCGCLVQHDGKSDPLVWYRYSSTTQYNFESANSSFISDFNSGDGHCGFTDWRIPSIVTVNGGYFGSSGVSGDFANLANYALAHGYSKENDLSVWLNHNGFGDGGSRNIQQSWYWASNNYPYVCAWDPLPCAWNVAMYVGAAVLGPNNSSNMVWVLPVRGGSLMWENVGSTGFSAGMASYVNTAFNPANNEPYVVYSDGGNGNKATVMRFNGTNWVNVGSPGFSVGSVTYTHIVFNPANNEPYVVYSDGGNGGKVTVVRFDGTNWVNVGSAGGISPASAAHIHMAFNPANNHPYVIYADSTNSYKVRVIAFDGTAWVNIGSPNFSAGEPLYADIKFDPANNQPYVVYQDGGTSFRAVVAKFDGTNWVNVGNPGFSAGPAYYISMAFNPANNQPYVVYQDGSANYKATVMTFDGTNWVNVGSPGFSDSTVDYTNIKFNPTNSQPYVVYRANTSGGKAVVMTFDGTNWTNVGSKGFSVSGVLYTTIAFNPANNQPYVAYQDVGNAGKVTVMTFPN